MFPTKCDFKFSSMHLLLGELFANSYFQVDFFSKKYFAISIPYVALMGTAAFMEYWVQRHGDQALFSYSIMGSCLLVSVILTAVIRLIAVMRERKLAMGNS